LQIKKNKLQLIRYKNGNPLILLLKYRAVKFNWSEIRSLLGHSEPCSPKQITMLYAAVASVAHKKIHPSSAINDELLQEAVKKLFYRRPISWHTKGSTKNYLTTVWENLYFYHNQKNPPSDELKDNINPEIPAYSETNSEDDIEKARISVLQFILMQFLRSRKGRIPYEWENLHKIHTEKIAPRAFLRWRNRVETYVMSYEDEIKKKIQDEMQKHNVHGFQNEDFISVEFDEVKIRLLITRNKTQRRWGIHKKHNRDNKFHSPSFLRIKPQYVLFPNYQDYLCAICESIKDDIQEELRKYRAG